MADEAEQEVDGFRDGCQRRRDRQRKDGRSRPAAVLLFSREHECRRNAQIAERLGEAGIHPDHVVGQRKAVGILRHGHGVGPGIGDGADRQRAAQRRELERHIDEVVQSCGDEQPLQKAIEEHARVVGRRDPARHRADARLKRGPDETDAQPIHDRKGRDAQKRPPQPGIQLCDHAGEPFFAGAVKDAGHHKAQQDAARHAGVHDLNAQDRGLTGGSKAGQAVRFGQLAQHVQRRMVDR